VSREGAFKRYAGLAGAAIGVVAAGAAVGVLADRRRKAQRATAPHVLGSLRGDRHTVTADDGLELYVEVDEPGSTRGPRLPTLVFIHGYALNLDSWHFQRAAFRGGHRLVLVDQRSHGRSARSRREHANIDQLGKDLACVLDQIVGDDPVVLIGHSMGGMTIMALADQHPELFDSRILGVVLMSTSSEAFTAENLGITGGAGRFVHRLAPSVVATMARTPRLVESGRRASSGVAHVLTRRLSFGGPVPEEYVDFTDEMLAGTPFDVVADFFPNFQVHDKAAALKALDATRTVVICGTDDAITPIENSRRIAELVPTAALVEIAGAGHMVLLERHTEVTDAIDDLLESVEDHE
jgi:pimeloyl-ACP methyl ester carboxylesterase